MRFHIQEAGKIGGSRARGPFKQNQYIDHPPLVSPSQSRSRNHENGIRDIEHRQGDCTAGGCLPGHLSNKIQIHFQIQKVRPTHLIFH